MSIMPVLTVPYASTIPGSRCAAGTITTAP